MYERLCQTFSGVAVGLHALGDKASAYLMSLRRSAYMAHFLPSVVPEQRELLHSGSPFSGWPFDEESLRQIILEHKSDVQVNINASLASSLATSLSKVLPILTKSLVW